MKLRTVAVFGVGYVLGSRAGRERYAQIVEAAKRAAARIEEYGAAAGHDADGTRGEGGAASK